MKYQDGNSGNTLKVSATVPVPAVLADQGKKGPDETSNGAAPAPLGIQLSCVAIMLVRAVAVGDATVRRAVVDAVEATGGAGDPLNVNATEMLRVCIPL